MSPTDCDETDGAFLDEAIGDLEAVAAMPSARLGVVGGPSSWLVAGNPGPHVVRRRWRPEVVTVESTRMIELTRAFGGVDLVVSIWWCWIAEGDIVATGDDTDLCRTPSTLGETLSESCAQVGGDPCR